MRLASRSVLFALGCAVALVGVASLPPALAGYTVTRSYVVVGDAILPCGFDVGTDRVARATGVHPGFDLSGACILLLGNERTVTITIQDATGLSVGGYYTFPGTTAGGVFCGSVADAPVPAGAFELEVNVDGAINGVLDCPLPPTAQGGGTTGQIVASFVTA